MNSKVIYELPIFSSSLSSQPKVEFVDMDIKITLNGFDDNDNIRTITLIFYSVVNYSQTSVSFCKHLYGAYDKIVEIIDSELLKKLNLANAESFVFWKPRHFVLFLDDIGLFEIAAQKIIVQ